VPSRFLFSLLLFPCASFLFKRAGLSKMHGLRHRYAQTRYEALTGWPSPQAGRPKANQLDPTRRQCDREARQQVSRELGHEWIAVTAVYLGS
jgi:hypothetical protein